MPWYFFVLIFLLFWVLVLMLPFRVRFQVGDGGDFAVQLSIGPFVLFRLPKPQKPIDLRQFTYAKHQKRLAKDAAKQKKKEKKTSTKRSVKQSLQTGATEAKKKENKLAGLLHMIRVLFTVLPELYGTVRCQIYRLVVVVGGDDVADVALHYGILSQSLACLLEYLSQSSQLLPTEPEALVVRADFLTPKTTVQADLSFQLRLGTLCKILIKGAVGFAVGSKTNS